MRRCSIVLGTLAIVMALSSTSCHKVSPEENISKHRQRAMAYIKNGEYHEAIVEFRNVLQLEPSDSDAHYQMALAHLKIGRLPNLREAYAELLRTVQLNSTNTDAHLKLGQLYLLGGEPTKAREQADIVLASAAQQVEALILRGRSLISERRYRDGLLDLQKAITLTPNNTEIHIDMARAYFGQNDKTTAETTLTQALSINPRSVAIMMALGDFYDSIQKFDQAQAAYKRALETEPQNEMTYLRLAAHYQRGRKLAEAEAVLEQLVASQPQSEMPQIQLGDFFTFIGQPQKALARYQRAMEVNASSTVARHKVLDNYLDQRKIPEAEAMIAPILQKDEHDVMGRVFKARIHLSRAQPDDAITLLQGVVKDNPAFADPHHFLGIAFMQKGQLAQARSAFAEALKYDPRHNKAHTALAQVHLAEGSHDLALRQAQEALQINPYNVQAALLLGKSYLSKGLLRQSEQIFDAVAKALPNDATGPYHLGLVARAGKNDGKALQYFEETLERQPGAIEPLAQIAELKTAQGKPAEARQRILKAVEQSPRNARLYALLGQFLAKAKDYGQAEQEYQKSIELDNGLLPAYMGLGDALFQTGRVDAAMKEYETVVSKDPSAIQALMMLGIIHERRHEFDKAQQRYEAILQRNPTFSPAANNLAWILSEHGGNLDVALSYARTAHEGNPNDPHISDTLGWLYYRKNTPLLAIALLKEAVEKLPNEAEVHFHYGMALFKANDKSQAKQTLRTALQLSPNFSGADEARQTLKQLL